LLVVDDVSFDTSREGRVHAHDRYLPLGVGKS
jgi:hypothetical protein